MGSSTTDVYKPIAEEDKRKILNFISDKESLTAQEVIDGTGVCWELVDQFLHKACYTSYLKYVNGKYEKCGRSENRIC
jgi:hypothetical protein